MNFTSDASIDGKLVYGYEDGWHWAKDNGHYNKGRDFFWIHWEIGDRKPHHVKLHIECPKAEIDAELNTIKCEMVEDFLAAHFVDLVEENGYSYKAGKRIKPEHRAKFKCTSPFHVVLNDEQSQKDSRSKIEMVHAALGASINEVVQRFTPQLKRYF